MELKNKYLTFNEYREMGGTLEQITFQNIEYRAEKKVDLYTFNRFRKIEEFPTELKMCIFDLISLVQQDNDLIKTESIGNYSVTRKDTSSINNDVKMIIKSYLSNLKVDDVSILYCGYDNEQ